MKIKNLQKVYRRNIAILIIITILFALVNSLIVKKTYATQYRDTGGNNIYSINESLYPGYANALQSLKSTHPNWTFTLLYTDLDWTDVLKNETIVNHSRSLIQGKTGEWLCTYPECDGIGHDGSSWLGASQTAVAYYMDPRNFLTEDKIFQFESLSYVPDIQTQVGVEAELSGTFMSNQRICDYYGNAAYGEKTFSQVIMEAATASGASPYYIASRIKQEIIKNGGPSPSASGTLSGYEGLFNFYNIGATPTVTEENPNGDSVVNGLIYARNNGWTNPETAIIEGAKWISNSYIAKGQDSLYLQKWDVDDQYLGLYSHQYMTNIQAPTSEASTVYKSYKTIFNNNLAGTSFNFIIPMYKNMPTTISRYPSDSTYVAQDAKLNNSANIRKTPAGESMGIFAPGYTFLRIELKAAKEGGHTWDKVMLADGTMGYIATQYITEIASVNNTSIQAYINENSTLFNGPRLEENGTVNVRSLYQGQEVTILEEGKYTFDGFVWDRIKLADNTVGYIPQNYVTTGTYGEKVKVTLKIGLALRRGAGTNNTIIKYLDYGTIVNRIELGNTKVSGYYWDKVITGDGITGYMAREGYNPYELWLTPIETTQQTTGEKVGEKADGKVKVVPTATLADVVAKYPNAEIVSGTDALGTGSVIRIDDVEHLIIKVGDISGDGVVDARDSLRILKYTVNTFDIADNISAAADLNGDNLIDARDALRILKYAVGAYSINL